jgi:hypothetical protein
MSGERPIVTGECVTPEGGLHITLRRRTSPFLWSNFKANFSCFVIACMYAFTETCQNSGKHFNYYWRFTCWWIASIAMSTPGDRGGATIESGRSMTPNFKIGPPLCKVGPPPVGESQKVRPPAKFVVQSVVLKMTPHSFVCNPPGHHLFLTTLPGSHQIFFYNTPPGYQIFFRTPHISEGPPPRKWRGSWKNVGGFEKKTARRNWTPHLQNRGAASAWR